MSTTALPAVVRGRVRIGVDQGINVSLDSKASLGQIELLNLKALP